MTVDRVRIDSNATSPFRVSVAGVDVNSAEFNTLIFDGNQSPLRLWSTGYLTVNGITWNEFQGGQNVKEDHTGSFPTLAGTSPVFITMWRRSAADPIYPAPGRLFTASFQSAANGSSGIGDGRGGGGGGVCSGAFVGTNFTIGGSASPNAFIPFNIYANYCVFRNAN